MKDDRLEMLSDKVRKGIPIDFSEALEVVEYQEALRRERDKSVWQRFIHWLGW